MSEHSNTGTITRRHALGDIDIDALSQTRSTASGRIGLKVAG